ncbi:MAG: BrnA antitoxin family protein [Parvularculaceae bacterium]
MKKARGRLKTVTLDELNALEARGELRDPRPDAPEFDVSPGFWENAKPFVAPGKSSVHLRLDSDVLDWFRAQGSGHLTRMNAVLRSYYEAHLKKPGRRARD